MENADSTSTLSKESFKKQRSLKPCKDPKEKKHAKEKKKSIAAKDSNPLSLLLLLFSNRDCDDSFPRLPPVLDHIRHKFSLSEDEIFAPCLQCIPNYEIKS